MHSWRIGSITVTAGLSGKTIRVEGPVRTTVDVKKVVERNLDLTDHVEYIYVYSENRYGRRHLMRHDAEVSDYARYRFHAVVCQKPRIETTLLPGGKGKPVSFGIIQLDKINPGICSPDGFIYWAPRQGSVIRMSADGDIERIQRDIPFQTEYVAGAMLPASGDIYYVPAVGYAILRISSGGNVTVIGRVDTRARRLTSRYLAPGCVGADGSIYFAPYDADDVVRILPDGELQFLELPSELQGWKQKYLAGGVLSPNGCIYFAPYEAAFVLCIRPDGAMTCARSCNNYVGRGAVAAVDNSVYFAPASGFAVLEIRMDGTVIEYNIGQYLVCDQPRYLCDGIAGDDGFVHFGPWFCEGFLLCGHGVKTLMPKLVGERSIQSEFEELGFCVSSFLAPCSRNVCYVCHFRYLYMCEHRRDGDISAIRLSTNRLDGEGMHIFGGPDLLVGPAVITNDHAVFATNSKEYFRVYV